MLRWRCIPVFRVPSKLINNEPPSRHFLLYFLDTAPDAFSVALSGLLWCSLSFYGQGWVSGFWTQLPLSFVQHRCFQILGRQLFVEYLQEFLSMVRWVFNPWYLQLLIYAVCCVSRTWFSAVTARVCLGMGLGLVARSSQNGWRCLHPWGPSATLSGLFVAVVPVQFGRSVWYCRHFPTFPRRFQRGMGWLPWRWLPWFLQYSLVWNSTIPVQCRWCFFSRDSIGIWSLFTFCSLRLVRLGWCPYPVRIQWSLPFTFVICLTLRCGAVYIAFVECRVLYSLYPGCAAPWHLCTADRAYHTLKFSK